MVRRANACNTKINITENILTAIFNLILVLHSPKRSHKRQNIVNYWWTRNENCTLTREHHSYHSFCMHNSYKLIRSFILLLYTHTHSHTYTHTISHVGEKKLSRCSILHISACETTSNTTFHIWSRSRRSYKWLLYSKVFITLQSKTNRSCSSKSNNRSWTFAK